MPEIPDQQRPQPDIDSEQRRIDELDGSVDSKFRADTPEAAEKLTNTFVKRVNDVQGRIRQLRTQADVRKNAKQEGWQQLEEACGKQEKRLADALKKVTDPAALEKAAQELEQKINATLSEMEADSAQVADVIPEARA